MTGKIQLETINKTEPPVNTIQSAPAIAQKQTAQDTLEIPAETQNLRSLCNATLHFFWSIYSGFVGCIRAIVECFSPLEKIPTALGEDEFFKKNTCPILDEPLRFPVRDRNHPMHVYEKRAILEWLERNPTSPLTRETLTVEDLIACDELQKEIETHLNDYYARWWNFFS